MASAKKHQEQYEKNRKFMDELLSNQNPQNDWIVTVAFYSALHLIDKTIVSNPQGLKPKDHLNRNQQVGRLNDFKSIRSQYLAMYSESRRSRYDCIKITDQTRKNVITYLEEIEKQLNK